MKNIILKISVSLSATVLLGYHLFVKKIEIDPTFLFFSFLILLPWILSIIKSIEFLGLKIELKDAKSATQKIIRPSDGSRIGFAKEMSSHINISTLTSIPDLKVVAKSDPNLALVGFRIEIEKRIRKIAEQKQLTSDIPLKRLVNELLKMNVLPYNMINGLLELINLGNRAAHGVKVSFDAIDWVLEKAPEIISLLDNYADQKK